MESFLCKVAHQLWTNHPNNLEQQTVVFNNRRAGLFLQQQLSLLHNGPFFLPRIIGMDDLVANLSKMQIVPHEFLLFELFDIHRSNSANEAYYNSFEKFMPLGEMMLSDFSEIDLYCANAKQLLGNLYELKQIGEWDISGNPPTPFQQEYLNFYHSLLGYYNELRQRLAKNGQAYSGMAYRHVAEHIDSMVNDINGDRIYFVGFNALSKSENIIVDTLVRQGRGVLLFDGDSYYFDDEHQEAGKFLRQHRTQFHADYGFDNHFAHGTKRIHIFNCPETLLQTKVAGRIVEQLINKDAEQKKETTDKEPNNEKNTAIVLADEGLLIPLLNSLPDNIGKPNVTMGFPFIQTNVHSLITKLLSLYNRSRNGMFHHSDVTELLSDHLLDNLTDGTNRRAELTKHFFKNKQLYIDKNHVYSLLQQNNSTAALGFLFDEASPDTETLLHLIHKTVSLLADSSLKEHNTKEINALVSLTEIIDYLERLQDKYQYMQDTKTLEKLYLRMAQRHTVSFIGEPITERIQILGMLETRCLDFDRVIILSANEGILPSGRNNNSLIPLSLKYDKMFRLPTFEDKDAVYAYNFYRLIQRADEVYLLYSSESDGVGKGEPSRFLMQIKDELAPKHSNIKIFNNTVSADTTKYGSNAPDSIAKSEDTLQQLRKIADNGFSPSALNNYRYCPLKFYYENILSATTANSLEEDLEHNELGNFIHDILKAIYQPLTDKRVYVEALEHNLANIDDTVETLFKDNLLKGRSLEGKNYIYKEVAKIQLKNFLKKEIAFLKEGHTLQIKEVENDLVHSLVIDDENGKQAVVNIKGRVDRIDIADGEVRISDYKSGGVKPTDLKVDKKDCDIHNVPDKWFQVMTYAWLYSKEKHVGQYSSGIFALRSLKSDFLPAKWSGETVFNSDDTDLFESKLKELIGEIMDPHTDFTPNPKRKDCPYCDFKVICHKL